MKNLILSKIKEGKNKKAQSNAPLIFLVFVARNIIKVIKMIDPNQFDPKRRSKKSISVFQDDVLVCFEFLVFLVNSIYKD